MFPSVYYYSLYCPNQYHVFCNSYLEEEEHNWIFSADQMESEGAGLINSPGPS